MLLIFLNIIKNVDFSFGDLFIQNYVNRNKYVQQLDKVIDINR